MTLLNFQYPSYTSTVGWRLTACQCLSQFVGPFFSLFSNLGKKSPTKICYSGYVCLMLPKISKRFASNLMDQVKNQISGVNTHLDLKLRSMSFFSSHLAFNLSIPFQCRTSLPISHSYLKFPILNIHYISVIV